MYTVNAWYYKHWAYTTYLSVLKGFIDSKGGGGGLVAGYHNTKKSVSKQDMLQCWSKYFLNCNAFLSFQNLVKSWIHFNSTYRQLLSRNYLILRFDVILRHDWPIKHCLLRVRVFFEKENKEIMCWSFHWLAYKRNSEH